MLLKATTRAVVVLASVNNLTFQNSKTRLNLELYTWNSNLTINYTNYDVPNTPKTAKGGIKDFQKGKKSINQTKKFHDGICFGYENLIKQVGSHCCCHHLSRKRLAGVSGLCQQATLEVQLYSTSI